MRSLIFGIFALSLAAHAQPLEGPWDVREFPVDFPASEVRLCAREDSLADLFVRVNSSAGGTISHSVFDMDNHEPPVVPNDLALPEGWTHHIDDVQASGNDWYAMVTSMETPSGGTTRGTLFRGGSNSSQQNILFEDYWYGHPWYGGSDLQDCHLSARPGGGVVIAGLILGSWGWEFDTWAWTAVIPAGSVAPLWTYSFWPTTFIPNSANVHAVSLESDSALVLFHQYEGIAAALAPLPPSADSLPSESPVACPVRAQTFARTAGGRLLCLSAGPPIRCYEFERDGSCHFLSQFTSTTEFQVSAWNPRYGFAAVLGDSSLLFLARFDTSGADALPLGVFHVCDPGYVIIESDVAITDDGRVVAAWLEQTESQPASSRLMLASVGWDTYLDTDDSDFIPHPSSFILSAFPNPFNSTLRIEYELPRARNVELAVFNTLGQKVETLRSGWMEAGQNEALWTPRGAGGLYFVRLIAGEEIRTAKVLFVP